MPGISDFINGFGWIEFVLVLVILGIICGIREGHRFSRKKKSENVRTSE